jgi:phosphoribosylaminoimidazolecarboxamide formyltransferase/IMP cyclohydrolase
MELGLNDVKRALLSVSDKAGLVDFAKGLAGHGVQLISTGGTKRVLEEAGLEVASVSTLTGFPEMMDGRVKTLHPHVHAGILARANNDADSSELEAHGIAAIDLVVVNLYPFREAIEQPGVTRSEALAKIDIGGPTMIRAAAKNHPRVTVVTSPEAYPALLESLDEHDGRIPIKVRERLAGDAFLHTAQYDSAIASYLQTQMDAEVSAPPAVWGEPLERSETLRYGENPHQAAGLYVPSGKRRGLALASQLQGKALSYNNWLDMDGAFCLARDLGPTGVAVIKHTNPCGAARSETSLLDAYRSARACDPTSSFGGIVATRGTVDAPFARELVETFLEVIIAGRVTAEAQEVLSGKKRLRVLTAEDAAWEQEKSVWLPRPVAGALLVQENDALRQDIRGCRVATNRSPTEEEWLAMEFGWMVVKHVKSNAIVFTRSDRTVGIGAGQMSRVDSSRIAVMKAQDSLEGTAVSSDAFFPFADGVEAAAEAGATAIIQPGGSIRDDEVIAAADRLGLTMVFTGHRHFKH